MILATPVGLGTSCNKPVGERWNNRKGDCHGSDKREGLGKGEWPEKLTLGGFHREYGEKTDDGCERGSDHGAGDFSAGSVDDFQPVLAVFGPLEMLKYVFRKDDAHVDDGPDRDRYARQGYNIGIDLEYLHGDEREENCKRKGAGNDKGVSEVKQHQHGGKQCHKQSHRC